MKRGGSNTVSPGPAQVGDEEQEAMEESDKTRAQRHWGKATKVVGMETGVVNKIQKTAEEKKGKKLSVTDRIDATLQKMQKKIQSNKNKIRELKAHSKLVGLNKDEIENELNKKGVPVEEDTLTVDTLTVDTLTVEDVSDTEEEPVSGASDNKTIMDLFRPQADYVPDDGLFAEIDALPSRHALPQKGRRPHNP